MSLRTDKLLVDRAEREAGVVERAALAAACGAADCLADSPGMFSADDVSRILPLVEVSES